ncbi:hypothetical protein [Aureibacillus halotolerans]|uniref:Uncharacterized protein n=1 Tax=Aureibacillus halotolerans TaxID=1508390 RepID=A0A4R6UD77_9BACI|nr:hypothetical protein [Aureibacillus halotolerans]TDQ43029.1 hypothetical protein EV213_101461 [Aureibacillus halotolerans]
MSTVLLQQNDPKVLPMYWVFTVNFYVLVIIISLGLIGLPVYLFATDKPGWAVLSIIGVGLAFFILRWTMRRLHPYFWENLHRNQYTLTQEGMRYSYSDVKRRETLKGEVLFKDIPECRVVYYVAKYHYSYVKGHNRRKSPHEVFPALHLKIGSVFIPVFLKDHRHLDHWLDVLRAHNIPMTLQKGTISEASMDELDEETKKTDGLPFTYEEKFAEKHLPELQQTWRTIDAEQREEGKAI